MRQRVRVTGAYVNRVKRVIMTLLQFAVRDPYQQVCPEFAVWVELPVGFRPLRARYFLLLAQEKVPKEKGTR